eukprot:jgi/Psemu1/304352/fgenesh1_kg.147_\
MGSQGSKTVAIATTARTGGAAKFHRSAFLDPKVYEYSMNYGFQESPIAEKLRFVTDQHERSIMMGHPSEAALFSLLLQAMKARKVIEVGVFTGYSTLIMAQALQQSAGEDEGTAKLVALDVSEEYAAIGRDYWKEAGVENVIDLRIGPAKESMQQMIQQDGEEGTYDFCFIDADKPNYIDYYELCLKLLRTNGIIAIDNVLWSGRVVDDTVSDENTVALRDISRHVQEDDRVEHVMLPFADGVTLARKK